MNRWVEAAKFVLFWAWAILLGWVLTAAAAVVLIYLFRFFHWVFTAVAP